MLTLWILKRHIIAPNRIFWAIIHPNPLRIGACSLFKETWMQKQNDPSLSLQKVYISPTWGDAPLEPIAIKFGSSLYFTKVIKLSKFGVDWFSSFDSGEAQKLTFAIGTTTGPYHCSATALARDHYTSEARIIPARRHCCRGCYCCARGVCNNIIRPRVSYSVTRVGVILNFYCSYIERRMGVTGIFKCCIVLLYGRHTPGKRCGGFGTDLTFYSIFTDR